MYVFCLVRNTAAVGYYLNSTITNCNENVDHERKPVIQPLKQSGVTLTR